MGASLKEIYSVFSLSPLQPEQHELYVDLEAVRGHGDVVRRMAEKLRLADASTCQVLTGHRGSGKSTELARLRQELQTPAAGAARYFVVQVQAVEELDLNDIDFPEVLIAIVRQLAEQLRKEPIVELKPGFFARLFQGLKNLLHADVTFDKLEFSAVFAKLGATIKSSPGARRQFRQALEPDTGNWLTAANDLIGQAVAELGRKGYAGLVVIVDDLDKMITRPHESAGCSTTEYLFVRRSAQLTALKCHMVYTLPIELAYSQHVLTIKQQYGGDLPVVPMTKLATRPPNSRTHAPGLKKFREIISARLKSVGATEVDLFHNNRTRDDLIKLTGGQPTELMRMIREAIVSEGLPIGPVGVRRCRTEASRSYRRLLLDEHWPLIEEVRRTGDPGLARENETAFGELLDSRALLLYVNDGEWYGVNPAIEDLRPPQPISPGEVVS